MRVYKSMSPFEQLVAEHGQTVLRVCRAVVGVDDAEDAWSETFLAALTAYPQLPEDANVRAWLTTIAHRKAIDVIRARTRAPIAVAELPERESRLGRPGLGVGAIWGIVATLPQKQREAIAYHYLAGLPHADVADILGGTVDAARRAASDGIASLRVILAESNREEWVS